MPATCFILATTGLSAAVAVGASSHGTRQFIPITGGRFSGANGLEGEIMAGGVDGAPYVRTTPGGAVIIRVFKVL
jgi:hypothetical protein